MLTCSAASYFSGSVLPVVILCALVVVLLILLYRNFPKLIPAESLISGRLDKHALIPAAVFLCMIQLYIGFSISHRQNAVCEVAANGEYPCSVTSVTYDLSGDLDLTVRLDGGALAKVSFYGDSRENVVIDPGDSLLLSGKLKMPEKAGNPGEFDYKEYLRSKGISYHISCDSLKVLQKASFPLNLTGIIQRFFFYLRKYAIEAVTVSSDIEETALTAAVCTGDRSLIDKGVQRDFKMACCSHLLAVSGTHFAGFLACVPMLIEILGIERKKAFAVHVIFCILIGCLTGWGDSVTRAAIMSICLYAMRDWLSALSLAAVIMIISDPFSLMSSGFQMSFCSVIAIKIYSGKITRALMRLNIGEKIASVLSVTLSASLGMIPFWSDISMRPDPEHLLIQIAGSFIAGLCCMFFVPCVFLCSVFPFISGVLSTPLRLCILLLRELVSAGSKLSEFGGIPVHLNKVFLSVLGLTVFFFLLPPCLIRRIFLKITALILAFLIGFEFFNVFNRPVCTVVFADVGQGDCCFIMTEELNCLIDCGTVDEGSTSVCNILDYYGISRVDVCIMSHWDVDHAGGFSYLSSQQRTKNILTSFVPGADEYDKDVQEYFKAVDMTGSDRALFISQLAEVSAGDRIILSDAVFIDVLYPSGRIDGGNEASLVLSLHIKGEKDSTILFTGDIGTKTESVLIESGMDIDCDILKVAHHGSKYSSSIEFINACSPEIAVISVGANNFYGHPAPETIERLETYGCEVFRTDQEGAVVMEY